MDEMTVADVKNLVEAFFLAGMNSPVTAELAAVARRIEGVGCESTGLNMILERVLTGCRCACLRRFQHGLCAW